MTKLIQIAGMVALLMASPAWANIACGAPPAPPAGCKVDRCVCDANGQNCAWTFACK